MFKFLLWRRFSAATVATVATKFKKQVATLFPQGSNTGSNTLLWYAALFSRLKSAFYSRVGSNGSNTFPNFVLETRFPDSHDLGDEFNHEDYDEWWEDVQSGEESLGPVEEVVSWTRRAVDELIADEEREGNEPPTIGDIRITPAWQRFTRRARAGI